MRHLLVAVLCIGLSQACSSNSDTDGTAAVDRKSPDVEDAIRQSLDRASLKSVTVKQDREKGVVTLSGNVLSDQEKSQADSLAKMLASGQVVANELIVTPFGAEADAKKIANVIDDGIESNFKALLIQSKLDDTVNYDAKAGVLTLSGSVRSPDTRARVEKLGASVPNVTQVVNELQVKEQKATSTGN